MSRAIETGPMNEEAAQSGPIALHLRPHNRTVSTLIRYWPLLLSIIGLSGTLIAAGPTLLWWYHTERAGYFMDIGLVWSQSRQVDDLPQFRNESALHSAVVHLNAAIYWRPGTAYTYRMLGQSYAALHDWSHAVQSFEEAKMLAPRNPLAQWEAGLVYEQMWYAIREAPSDGLVGTLAEGQIQLPNTFSRKATCGKALTNCLIGQSTVAQPYAGFTETSNEVRFLLLSPPVQVRYRLLIPPERPGLRFLLGRDPAATSPILPATYHIWLSSTGMAPKEVYSRRLTADTIKHGWVPDAVDLHNWVGQVVTLTLGITLDPPATSALGYGWGDVALTTGEAAHFAIAAPEAQVRAVWHGARLDTPQLSANGDAALQRLQYQNAFAWYKRALAIQPSVSFDLLFRSAVAAVESGRVDTQEFLDGARRQNPALDIFFLSTLSRLKVMGASLRWMTPFPGIATYGTPLTAGASDDTYQGHFWWPGEAVVVLNVQQDGLYLVKVNALHTSPPPITLVVGIDGKQLIAATLERGDGSEQIISTATHLSKGLHTLNIWYAKDNFSVRDHRNAVVQWMTVEEHEQ